MDGALTRTLIAAVLDAADAHRLTQTHLQTNGAPSTPTHVLAFGKAGASMARAVAEWAGDALAGGVVIAPDATLPADLNADGLTWHGADHPHPTQRNIDAAHALASCAASIPSGHACVVGVSGGGSAHLCLPKDGVTLEEIRDTTRALNERGATIQELNAARAGLERLKHGGLARTIPEGVGCRALVLSDVIGNDPRVIASGPMVDEQRRVEHPIVGSNAAIVGACVAALDTLGYGSPTVFKDVTGNASDAGRRISAALVDTPGACVVLGGETTVDARGASGRGGPVSECVLSAALTLRGSGGPWTVLGLASDGIDGPTDAAGGVIHSSMLDDPIAVRDAKRALASHGTLDWLDARSAAVRTGVTGTNVNDVIVAVRDLDAHERNDA